MRTENSASNIIEWNHLLIPAWGKTDRESGECHHLAHHSADVASVFIALLDLPLFRKRAERAFGKPLDSKEIECMGALVFLHDIGKLATGFQVKGWTHAHGLKPRGHIQCGWRWCECDRKNALSGHAVILARWPSMMVWFTLLFSHHGRPVPQPGESWGQDAFAKTDNYDWEAEEFIMGNALARWFPAIFDTIPPKLTVESAHYLAGLIALADWIGSDRDAFPFVASFEEDYWEKTRKKSRYRLEEIGLDTRKVSLSSEASWSLISDHPTPNPAQLVISEIPSQEQLLILEAETGSGKTEAALWRFAQLFEAGTVDSLYFAVPTRTAARQLQQRINRASERMFSSPAPEAVLAIPGQALSGEASGTRLPDFRMQWDDTDTPDRKPSRWAAEHATRFLAAQIAVGTVDQVMMAGLRVTHAHLRGSALSRSLLVIDEVHASDAWMTAIQKAIVSSHVKLGGHVLLMSATLGARARSAWLEQGCPEFSQAVNETYPMIWTRSGSHPVHCVKDEQKEVHVSAHTGWSGQDGARHAIQAARHGARVLVIRNTVERARDTWQECMKANPDLVFELNGVCTLHHSRFAAEDRVLLDQGVEESFGRNGHGRGVVLVGTQTLEQSLDIDADFLVTDLCPMDVLLQRTGRLHRHRRERPSEFEQPRLIVLCPEDGLSSLIVKAENGLGNYGRHASLSGVYLDMSGLEATRMKICSDTHWHIPKMNRQLVEYATHPEVLTAIAQKNGWEDYHLRVTGKIMAETQGAELVILNRNEPFPEQYPPNEMIRTRLGGTGILLDMPENAIGPFGQPIRSLTLPAHWSPGIADDDPIMLESSSGPLMFSVAQARFLYDESGLQKKD